MLRFVITKVMISFCTLEIESTRGYESTHGTQYFTCENTWFFGESGTTIALVGNMGVGLRIGSGVGIVVGISWVCCGDTAMICDEGNGCATDTFLSVGANFSWH